MAFFRSHGVVEIRFGYSTDFDRKLCQMSFHSLCIHSSQLAVDICGDIPDGFRDAGSIALQHGFDLFAGVDDGGVILAEFLTDVGETEVGQFPDQVHGDLSCFCRDLVLQGAAKNIFLNGVESADFRNDQAGRRQSRGFAFVHVFNCPGNGRKVDIITGQIAVSHDFFHGAFNLTNVCRDIFRNIRANVIFQRQSEGLGLVFDDGHSGFIVRRLNVSNETPFKAGFQAVLQMLHLVGRPVRGQND